MDDYKLVTLKNLRAQGWNLLVWETPEKKEQVITMLLSNGSIQLPAWQITQDIRDKEHAGVIQMIG